MFRVFKQFFVFLWWKWKDSRKPFKQRPFGIFCYVGRPGFGKTLSMVDKLNNLKIKFPKALVYTNFGYIYQHGEITCQNDLLEIENGEDGVIFGIDELQNTFNSRNWNAFPPEMLSLITQNRKKSKMILCTAQSFSMIDKNFRLICNYIVECRNMGGRWFFQRAFEPEDYKEADGVFTPRNRAWRHSFIATNEIFNSYNTLEVIDAILKDVNRVENVKKGVV